MPYLLVCGSLQKDLSLLNPGQGIKGIIRTNTMFFFLFCVRWLQLKAEGNTADSQNLINFGPNFMEFYQNAGFDVWRT